MKYLKLALYFQEIVHTRMNMCFSNNKHMNARALIYLIHRFPNSIPTKQEIVLKISNIEECIRRKEYIFGKV